jgi:hypothetical protein
MRCLRSHGVPQPSISDAHAAARITETIEGQTPFLAGLGSKGLIRSHTGLNGPKGRFRKECRKENKCPGRSANIVDISLIAWSAPSPPFRRRYFNVGFLAFAALFSAEEQPKHQ